MVIMFKYCQGNVIKILDLYWEVKEYEKQVSDLRYWFMSEITIVKFLSFCSGIFEEKNILISFDVLCNINYKHLKWKIALTRVAQLVGHCSSKPKATGSVFRSGHMSAFQVRYLVRACKRGNQLMFLFHINASLLFLSPFPSF